MDEQNLCAVIAVSTYDEALENIQEALLYADYIELRLDYFVSINFELIKQLVESSSLPCIATIRSSNHGGYYTGSLSNYHDLLRQVAKLKVRFIDIEVDKFCSGLVEKERTIISYHGGSSFLDELYHQIIQCPAALYKIACSVNSSLECLKALLWAKQYASHLIFIPLGEYGSFGRLLGKFLGFPLTYAPLGQKTVAGQISIQEMVTKYHLKQVTSQTKIYALLGGDVERSISDITHNALCKEYGLDALYIKIKLTQQEELLSFLEYAQALGLSGLSVTNPFKEAILPFVTDIDPEALAAGAINTIVFAHSRRMGYNTDGKGALHAIEKKILPAKKRLVIVGYGGAARAIAYEAKKRGAIVVITGRNNARASFVAASLGVFSSLTIPSYDILIHCTSANGVILDDEIRDSSLVMEIMTKPFRTSFIASALKKSCQVIYGMEMFAYQAALQWQLWEGEEIDTADSSIYLEKVAQTTLLES
jgi:3-dehydroquinate dehydratase / shikimate dehydrogenase